MNNENITNTINIPVTATYRIIDGEAVMIDAKYANVPTDAVAQLLMRGLNMPTPECQKEGSYKNGKNDSSQ